MDNLIFKTLHEMQTVQIIFIIFFSLYILGKAADHLVDDSVTLSLMWGVPKVIIGATIVSLGTTIPEVTVSIMAAVNGKPGLALGNAIGSIITNNTLILGIVIFIGEIVMDKNLLKKQGGFLVLTTILLSVVASPIFSASNQFLVSRGMGLIFLLLLVVYLYISIIKSMSKKEEIDEEMKDKSNIIQLIRISVGIIFIILSSKILIPSVEITATRVGIPESIIAATLVAFGTSVPELMTSLTAVRKGYGELAIGNVIGANILNVLFVIGASALISKDGLLFPPIYFTLQVPMMVLTSMIIYIKGINKDSKFKRKDGSVLLGIYVMYIMLNYLR